MPQLPRCDFCHNEMPMSATICPHCGWPAYYPNVRAAEDADEVAALESRYQAAVADASGRGAARPLRNLETEVSNSKAVIARSAGELQRLAKSDKEIYATYYELLQSGVISHTSDKWSLLRALADETIFHGYKKEIRFAALTLDARGLHNYGDCYIMLRTEMIAHRASAFEENTVMFMKHHDVRVSEADNLPRGYRSAWDGRGKLCVAKLFGRIDADTTRDEYPKLLLSGGATTADDDFVEVHVWGPMTARTFEQVTVKARTRRAHKAIIDALKNSFDELSVKLQVI